MKYYLIILAVGAIGVTLYTLIGLQNVEDTDFWLKVGTLTCFALGIVCRIPFVSNKLGKIGNRHRDKKHQAWVSDMKTRYGDTWGMHINDDFHKRCGRDERGK